MTEQLEQTILMAAFGIFVITVACACYMIDNGTLVPFINNLLGK